MSTAQTSGAATDERVAAANHALKLAAVGAGAGLVAGLVIGVVARLVMRLLAATSPGALGRVTDDQAVVGDITFGGTVFLGTLCGALGAAAGLVYAGVRHALPGRPSVRALTYALVAAPVGGSVLVKDATSFDYGGALQPRWFAVVAFVLIPGLGAWLAAAGTEWWHALSEDRPWWTDGVVVTTGVLGLVACFPLSVPLLLATLVVAQVAPLRRAWTGRPGRALVRTVLVVVLVLGVLALATDVASIVGDEVPLALR